MAHEGNAPPLAAQQLCESLVRPELDEGDAVLERRPAYSRAARTVLEASVPVSVRAFVIELRSA